MRHIKSLVFAALTGLTATGCLELEVTNPNDPDAARALRIGTDIEALVGGGWGNWWSGQSSSGGVGAILGTVSYMTSATAANFGMVEFSSYPKIAVHHLPSQVYYGQFTQAWTQNYRAIAGVTDGLRVLEEGTVKLDTDGTSRAKAFGNFTLGLAHASTAILFDQGYIYDPSIPVDEVKLAPAKDVFAAAMKYFDAAIAEATGKTWRVPATWMSKEVTAADLIRLTYSYKARFRAAMARTPTERAAVDWAAVKADAEKGITSTWGVNVRSGSGFSSSIMSNLVRYGPWAQLSYQILGMADQSGRYQRWIAKDPATRHPNLSDDQQSDPFLIITPDTRFPRGTTLAEQQTAANRGRIYESPTASGGVGAQWARPDRGTYRWSYYRNRSDDQWQTTTTRTDHPEITIAEMDLLRAEAALRTNDRATAATLINKTRVAAGLSATDANGTNTSCVPKLPNGNCGDLLEMLKWEKRLETKFYGLYHAPWYFDSRGWGDLNEGVFLQTPVPGRELQLLQLPEYTFGGPGGTGSAPKGTYGF
jgi:hypothetical protein